MYDADVYSTTKMGKMGPVSAERGRIRVNKVAVA